MIYLITGNMGTGKTSKAVSMILNNEDGLFKMKLEDGTEVPRPLYFCHIDGLDKAKFGAQELTEDDIKAAPLRDILPDGAVLIVDEAHYTYPVRSAGKQVPPYVQELAELRHHGHTLILMTQHPSQLDVFVRNLVSKHIHLERKAVGMKQYWWYKCVTNLDNPASISGTESAAWKPPKAAFKYYKSASQHQKFKKKVPVVFYALFLIFGLIIWKGYGVYSSYKKATSPPEVVAGQTDYSKTADASGIAEKRGSRENQSLDQNLFVPTIAEKAESKPLYDTVRQVKTFEYPVACISGGNSGCTCYTHQGTAIKEIDKKTCKTYVKDGLPFNPYKDEREIVQNRPSEIRSRVSPAEAAEVLVMGGKSLPNLMYDGYVEAGEQFRP